MTALPTDGFFSVVGRLFSAAKDAQDAMILAAKEKLGSEDVLLVTMSPGGALSAPSRPHLVIGNNNEVTEQDLNRILLPVAGGPRLLYLQALTSSQKVAVHSAQGGDGEIILTSGVGSRFRMTNSAAGIMLVRRGVEWREMFRSYGSEAVGSNSNGQWSYSGDGALRNRGQKVTSASANVAVVFPRPFPNTEYQMIAAVRNSAAPSLITVAQYWDKTGTGFTLRTVTTSAPTTLISATVEWFAEGYAE